MDFTRSLNLAANQGHYFWALLPEIVLALPRLAGYKG